MKLSVFLSRSACALLISFPVAAWAQGAALVEAGSIVVTGTDIRGDALRIPEELRKDIISKPESVSQLASNLATRRALAAEFEAAGGAKEPAVQAAIQIARDKVLADLLFARMDAANKPPRVAVEALAETNYKANPKRFDLPQETGASHILVRIDTPQAKEKAAAILADLKAGADFAKVAAEKSEDTSAKNGGSLGYFQSGLMVPEFEVALAKLQKPGELSEVVETRFGFHIIKLDGRRSPGIRPFEQVKDVLVREAEAKILNDRRMEEVQRIQKTFKFNQPAIEAFANSVK